MVSKANYSGYRSSEKSLLKKTDDFLVSAFSQVYFETLIVQTQLESLFQAFSQKNELG